MTHKAFNVILCLALLAGMVGFIPTPVVQAAEPQPETAAYPYATDHLIVKLRAEARVEKGTTSTHIASLDRALAEMKATALEAVPGLPATYLVKLESKSADILKAVDTLNNDPAVEYAEPDYLAKFASAPDDPRYSEQWGLAKVQAEGAWDETMGSPTVVIAIIDSGIDLSHEDLSPNLWLNPGEIPANSLDDDNNGFVDDVLGWNFVNATNDVQDFIGHGSLVAGVAAARSNNTLGIAGMCGNCRIMPVKITQVSGFANYSDIAAGVNYAADKGAKVINLSVGGYADSITVKNAINNALSKGIVVVGGVGNDNKSDKFYPAAYEGVIAVAGTDESDVRVTSSNYGTWVDISAPGQNILSTTLGDYSSDTGTSYATPFVSGAAGLLLSLHPEWTPAMVRSQFMHTTDGIDGLNPGYEGKLGSGRLNAALATQPSHPILIYHTYTGNGTPELRPDFGSTVALNVTLYNDWADAAGVSGTLTSTDPFVNITTATADFGTILAGGSQANTAPFSFDIAAGAGYNHAMPFTLALSANDGSYTTTLDFTITTRTSEEPVSGTIDADTTWTNDKTYKVTGTVGVAPGFTLTIQPGTVVKFAGNYSLNIGGTLIAQGTAAQPIRFEPYIAGGTWNRIFLDDTSLDAVTDADGVYQLGNILQYVNLTGATSGIVSTNATPFLEHVVSDRGGLTCSLGDTDLWLTDSTLTGDVNITQGGTTPEHLVGVTVHGSATIPASLVTGGTITGLLTIQGDGLVVQTSASGLTINGVGDVQEVTSSGNISISSGQVMDSETSEGNIIISTGGTISGCTTTGGSISVSSGGTISGCATNGGGISAGAGSTITRNNIENAPGNGITTSGTSTVTFNRINGANQGIVVSAGTLENNLVANTTGDGLHPGTASVRNNTLIQIAGNGVYLDQVPIPFEYNNFEFNTGTYDVYVTVHKTTAINIVAQNNWWGTTDSNLIKARIYDYNDGDFTLAKLNTTPVLTAPSQTAPAYVRSVTLDPASPVGIQTVDFTMGFSRPMNIESDPRVTFQSPLHNTWTVYNTNNSVDAIAVDADGSKWFGTWGGGVAHLDGTTWTVYNTGNSGLPDNWVYAIAVDANGSKWFGTSGSGVTHFDGTTWTVYNTGNSGLPGNGVNAIAVDVDGSLWIGGTGAAHFDGITWTVYNTGNSGLPHDGVSSITVDADGSKWFGTKGGVAHFDGIAWTVYNTGNSGLPHNDVLAIAIDPDGSHWFGTRGGGVAHLDGTTWTVYNTGNSGMPANYVYAIAVDSDGSHWFGGAGAAHFDGTTWTVYNMESIWVPRDLVFAIDVDTDGSKWFGTETGGAVVLWNYPTHTIQDNPTWLDDTQFQASYDFTTLIERGDYQLTVAGALDGDGMKIVSDSDTTFSVDYAGEISDTTPPAAPLVSAWGNGSLLQLSAQATASDPDSEIAGYRYAIGTTAGGADVINWTNTGYADITRTGLLLQPNQPYYVSFQARNIGGLWSPIGSSNPVVNGQMPIPAPTLTSLDPTQSVAGDAAFTLTVTGTNFVNGTVVRWNGSDRTTTYVSATQLTAAIPAADIATAGGYPVTVFTPAPGGGTSNALNFTVVPPNALPVALNDNYSTNEDTELAIASPGVLDNDTDADSDPLTAILVTDPVHGTLTQNADGSFTYTPDSNWNGSDSFTYKANDGIADSNTATVSIDVTTVNDVPVANAQSVSTTEDAAKAITLTATDPDGTTFTWTIVAPPTHGSLSGTAPDVTFTPAANYNGADSFTFKVNDSDADSNTAMVSINVTAVNDVPVANAQTISTTEDAAKAITLTATDPDDTSFTWTIVTTPAHGALSGTAPNITYSPTSGWTGSDSFTFKANDGTDDSNIATVSITVTPGNVPPVAADDSYSMNEDTVSSIAAPGVLDNDTDADSDPLTVILVTGPAHGTLTLNANGSFTYTPDANWYGSETFTYKANDGIADSNTATVSIDVTAVNDVPVVNAQSVSTTEDTAKAITLTATDPDDTTFTWTIVTPPAHGSLSGTAPDVTYTPAANFNGGDSFTFKVNDGDGDSNTAAVSIDVSAVNDVPVANAQSVSTTEDTTKAITLTATDLDDDTFTWTIVTPPAHGNLSGTAPDVTYTPAANYNGSDSFTFKVNDGDGDSNTATVSIDISAVNDVPVANPQSVSTTEDTAKGIKLTANDADDTTFTWTIVAAPAHGALSGTAPNVTYTPAENYNGADSFAFKVNDGDVDSNIATVSINVIAVNDAPMAVDDGYSIDEDTVLSIAAPGVMGNDTDADSNPLTVVLVTSPAHGTLTLNADGSFTYTPDANWYGTETFSYKVNDGIADSNVATVTITVVDVPETRSIYLPLIYR